MLFEIVTFNIDGIKRKHSRPSKLAGVAQQFGGNLSHLTCDYLIVRDQNTYPFRGDIEARRVIKTWVVLSWQEHVTALRECSFTPVIIFIQSEKTDLDLPFSSSTTARILLLSPVNGVSEYLVRLYIYAENCMNHLFSRHIMSAIRG